MTQSELEQAAQAGQIETIKDTSPQVTTTTQDFGQPSLFDFLPVLIGIRSLLKHLTAAPTFTPKTFLEQIQFVDTGTEKDLYLYFNNAWQKSTLNTLFTLQSDHKSIILAKNTNVGTTATTGISFTPTLIIGILHNNGSATPLYFGFWFNSATPYESTSIPCGNRPDSVTSFAGPDSSLYMNSLSFSGGTLTYHYRNNSATTDSVVELLIVGS